MAANTRDEPPTRWVVPAASVSILVKNVGAFGEAGAVVTDNAPAAGKILTLRDHDQIRKYRHSMIGWNRRTNGIQTAVLGVKSRHLETGMRSVAGTSSDMTPRRVGCAHSRMESLPPCL
jgi:DegT/DnrJ/EryC1/StrS aminotransferase family